MKDLGDNSFDEGYPFYNTQRPDDQTDARGFDPMRAPDYLPNGGIRGSLDGSLSAGDLPPFGTDQFDNRQPLDTITRRSTRMAYDEVRQGIQETHIPTTYEVAQPTADRYGFGATAPRTELVHESDLGTVAIVSDRYGLTVDFFPSDGSPPQYNHYFTHGPKGAVHKDTVNRGSLLYEVPPMGSVPHETRERMISFAQKRAALNNKQSAQSIAVGPAEIQYLAGLMRDAHAPRMAFDELYTIGQRRAEAHTPVSEHAAETASEVFDYNLQRYLERRGYDLSAFAFPIDRQEQVSAAGEYMYVTAGYRTTGNAGVPPIPTVTVDVYIPLEPDEAVAALTSQRIDTGPISPPVIAFRQRAITYEYDSQRRILTGVVTTSLICDKNIHGLTQSGFNADADDAQAINLFLQQQEF